MALEDAFANFTRRDWECESTAGTVRLAVIGVGGFARQRALPGIADSNRCETTVLVARPPERVTDIAETYGVDHIVDYDDFLAGECVDAYDAIYVAAPNDVHGEYATTAAEFGKHVLCETPRDHRRPRPSGRRRLQRCRRHADDGLPTPDRADRSSHPGTRQRRRHRRCRASSRRLLASAVGHRGPRYVAARSRGRRRRRAGRSRYLLAQYDPIHPRIRTQQRLRNDPLGGRPFADVDEHVAFQLEYESGATASCTASFDAHARSALELVGTGG